jgi:hypothetical protein
MLVERGVHVPEFHNQEQLAPDQVSEFAFPDHPRDPRDRRGYGPAAGRNAVIFLLVELRANLTRFTRSDEGRLDAVPASLVDGTTQDQTLHMPAGPASGASAD